VPADVSNGAAEFLVIFPTIRGTGRAQKETPAAVAAGVRCGAEEIRTAAIFSGNPSPLHPGSAESGAPATDPDLAAVMAAWPDLPDPVRRGILAMVASVYSGD
jgi:hypothetical protein